MADRISVIIADDHSVYREGVKTVLHSTGYINVIGEAAHGEALVALCRELLPDVVLTDIFMPVMDGITATGLIRAELPTVRVVALSIAGQESDISAMLDAGAVGYILKSAPLEDLTEAIQAAQRHQPFFCEETTEQLKNMAVKMKQSPAYSPLVQLSEKEIELVRLICEECTSKEIAARMCLSKRTVDDYRRKLLEKLGVKGVAGVIAYAIRKGIYEES